MYQLVEADLARRLLPAEKEMVDRSNPLRRVGRDREMKGHEPDEVESLRRRNRDLGRTVGTKGPRVHHLKEHERGLNDRRSTYRQHSKISVSLLRQTLAVSHAPRTRVLALLPSQYPLVQHS